MNIQWLIGFVIVGLVVLGIASLALWFISRILSYIFLRGKIKELWSEIPDLYRKIAYNLVIGLGFIYLVMNFSYSIQKLGEVEESVIDFMMSDVMMPFYWEKIPSIQEKNIPPFVFLNIDDDTMKKWKWPNIVPRDKLKNLIVTARDNNARLILVDIDVSAPTQGALLGESDTQLKGYLSDYITKCKAKENNNLACPPIIFGRALNNRIPPSDIFLTPKKSFLDELITESTPTESTPNLFQWGSIDFFLSSVTHQVRHWRLWEYTCSKDKAGVIPSVELLAMGFIKEKCTIKGIQEELSRSLQLANCNEKEQSLPKNVTLCNSTISTNRESIEHRIMYRIPWSSPFLVQDDADNMVLTTLPAHQYAKEKLESSLDLSAFDDSIVVIGATHRDAKDNYSTPIGKMPGSLLFVNAIHTLLQYGTIKLVPIWISFIMAGLLIIVTTISFHSNTYIMNLVLPFAIIGLLMVVSFFLLQYGMWLNVALPLIIIELYNFLRKLPKTN